MTKIFVYGTLLKGDYNHVLLGNSTFIGTGRTTPNFNLVDLGSFPGLINGNGIVTGEVYEVNEDTLARLDRLEGHPGFYNRTPITLEDGTDVETYILGTHHARDCKVIKSGSWTRRRF